jgi:hypothetical protein
MILARYPHVAASSIYTAAIRGQGRASGLGRAHASLLFAIPQARPHAVRGLRPHSPRSARHRRKPQYGLD